MGIVSPGFFGRRRQESADLPPGQYLTYDFPVLSAGATPHVPTDTWGLRITTEDGQQHDWDWASFTALPAEDVTVDLHCVTKWSKLGTGWRGVSLDTLLADVDTSADFAVASLVRRLHHEPSARGPARREGLGGLRVRRRAARAGARRPGAPARAAPVPLEVRQVAARRSGSPTRTSPGSGRASATTTTETRGRNSGTGATDLAGRARSSRPARRPRPRGPWCSTCPTGPATGRASTWTCGSPPRTATRPSGATPSPPPRTGRRSSSAIQVLEDGEVSPYLGQVLTPGDPLELRGPVGGHFVWDPADASPVVLVAGGSGVVPLLAMVRTRQLFAVSTPMSLAVVTRTRDGPDVRRRAPAAGCGGRRARRLGPLHARGPGRPHRCRRAPRRGGPRNGQPPRPTSTRGASSADPRASSKPPSTTSWPSATNRDESRPNASEAAHDRHLDRWQPARGAARRPVRGRRHPSRRQVRRVRPGRCPRRDPRLRPGARPGGPVCRLRRRRPRLVQGEGRSWLDLRGLSYLEFSD